MERNLLSCLIGDDSAGGFFAINGGALGNDPGKVYYLSPDNLKWEPMEMIILSSSISFLTAI